MIRPQQKENTDGADRENGMRKRIIKQTTDEKPQGEEIVEQEDERILQITVG